MATKRQLAVLLMDTYGKDQSFANKLDERDVAMQMGVVYNDLVAADIKANGVDRIDSGYIRTDVVQIQSNTSQVLRFFTVPFSILKLPLDRGIRQVTPLEDRKTQLIQKQSGASFIYKGLEAGGLLGQYGYEVRGNTCVLDDVFPAIYTELLFSGIPNGTAIDLNEELPVPAGIIGSPLGYNALFDQVLRRLGITVQVPYKKVSDNNPNTV